MRGRPFCRRTTGLCRAAVVALFLGIAQHTFADTWTSTPVDGWCWQKGLSGCTLSFTGAVPYVQTDDDDAITASRCYAQKKTTTNSITVKGWLSVYFASNFPAGGVVTSAKVYVQYQGSNTSSGALSVYVSDNKLVTGWYAGITNHVFTTNSASVPWSDVEQTYVYDVTPTLNTSDKINNCEVLVMNLTNSTGAVFFDYFQLEVQFINESPPVMSNGSGASNIQQNAATLCGQVLSGAASQQVYLYWGDTDGGTTPGSWAHTEDMGLLGVVSFTRDVTGLTANKTYYYRCYATSGFGQDWADSTASFTTLPPSVQFNATSSSGAEGITQVSLPVSLSSASAAAASVNYSVTGGTATNGGDFVLASGTLSFPAGVTATNIRITVSNDAFDEDDETIVVTLSSPSGASLGPNSSHTYTIEDNDATPTVSFAGPFSVSENLTNVVIVARLSAASGRSVSADYQTVQGTAIPDVNYSNRSGTLTWPVGQAEVSYTVPIIDDALENGTRTFTNVLSNPVNCTVAGNGMESVSILDDEKGTAVIDNDGGADAITTSGVTFRGFMSATGGVPTQVWIFWGKTDGGSNRLSWSNNIPLGIRPKGALSTNVSGVLTTNTTYYYRCYASNSYGAAWADSSTNFRTGPPKIQFAVASASGAESVTNLTVTFVLSEPPIYGLPVSVTPSVTGSTAQAGVDYSLPSGSITIPAGSSSTSITMTVVDDLMDEVDETIAVGLFSPVSCTIGPTNSFVYTIFDDDDPPTVWFSNTPYSVKEAGTNITIYVALSQASAKAVSVNYATSDGSAVAGTAYSNRSGTFSWTAGINTTKMFKVSMIDNILQEGNKTFFVSLSATQNCTIAGDPAPVVTIIEDDVQMPTVSNGAGATNVLWTTATLRGNSAAVYPVPAVAIFWGDADGGASSNSWQNRIDMGNLTGDFSTDLTGLVAGRTYYYRCYAESQAGSSWASATAGFATPAPLVSSPGTNYYVNDASTNGDLYCLAEGNSGNSGLSRSAPAISVQTVLNTYNIQPGDCIWIDTGTYNLSATLTVTNQDFGANGTSVVFRGTTSPQGSVFNRGSTSANVLTMTATGSACYVRFESLGFAGGMNGMNIVGSSGNPALGVEIVGCTANNNSSANSCRGIILQYCSAPVLVNNRCYSNGSEGIYLYNCSQSVVAGNMACRQRYASDNRGIFLSACPDSVASSNVCYGNRTGIKVMGTPSQITLIGNVCYSNSWDGLSMSANGCIAISNVCWGNSLGGIYAHAMDLDISGNVLRNNGECGIYADIPTDQRYRNNLIYSNAQDAIRVDGVDNKLIIENNTMVGPGGIRLSDPFYVTNRNNIIWAVGVSNAAIRLATSPGSETALLSEYNDLYATDGAIVGNWAGVQCNLSLWRAVSGGDTNSICADPLFVNPDTGDYHLQSKAGSWHGGAWQSDPVNSPCIDAGDPWAAFSNEPPYNGLTINQGSDGNTPEASKTYYTGNKYTVTVQSVPSHAGSASIWPVSTNSQYPTNRIVTVWETATNVNYVWGHWAGSLSGVDTQKSFRVTNAMAIQAVFDPVTFTVTASAGSAGGSISPSGAVSVVAESNVTFNITPNTNAVIADVVVDAVSRGITNRWTFSNVTNNHTITAYFNTPTWTITATAGAGGNIAPSGIVSAAHNSQSGFSITPGVGCSITNVVVDGVSRGVTNGWVFNNIVSNHTISAYFYVPTWTVTATAGPGGSISPGGAVIVTNGESATLSIAPSNGFVITNVVVDSVSRGATNSWTFLNVTNNHTVQAFFGQAIWIITAGAGTGGSISPGGAVSVTNGNQATFTIAATGSYFIADVVVDSVSRGATNSWTFLNVTSNHTIQASFGLIGFWTINASAGPGGSITPSGAVSVAAGNQAAFTIAPGGGYAILDVVVDSVSRGATNSWTFLNVTNNHAIAASFTATEQYTSHNTPYSWLALYGITNNQEAADTNDPDSDLAFTWQEYVAGTVPTNGTSVLCVAAAAYSSSVSRVRMTFSTVSGKTYTPQFVTNLKTGVWTNTEYSLTVSGMLLSNSFVGAGGNTNIFANSSVSTSRHFRIKVQ